MTSSLQALMQHIPSPSAWGTLALVLLHIVMWSGISVRILLRNDLARDARVAWILLLLVLPYGGLLLYLLFGEVYLGKRLGQRQKTVLRALGEGVTRRLDWANLWARQGQVQAQVAPRWQGVFTYAASVHGFAAVTGNHAELLADGDSARARLLQDLDAAQQHIHLGYYIWLPDATGTAVAEALLRAAKRGVACRVLVDALGSRLLLKSPLWPALAAAGVETAACMPFSWWRPLSSSRLDVRNHRKMCIIDGRISHIGSQNCADAAFAIKANYAPWIDIMLRVQGRVVAQNQLLFLSDWMLATGQAFEALAATVVDHAYPHTAETWAQVVASGPAARRGSSTQFLVSLISAAQRQLWISTPYFVPDVTVLQALSAAAWRGVDVRLILPARNDSWVVAAVSHSHFYNLLLAGVKIYEHGPGLLHAKTITVDGQLSFLGSTNIDMRSFGLNYENNLLLQDADTALAIMQRQQSYCQSATLVTLAAVARWPKWRRISNHLLAALGPLL